MFDSLAALASASSRYVPTLVLVWLALFFGRTLRAGEVPLIERVARIGKPELAPVLCRYARGLTVAWCVYFVGAAILAVAANLGFRRASLGVVAASVLLFVGEHWIRRRLFPGEYFPGLIQQVRDTVQVWRPRHGRVPPGRVSGP